MLQDTFSNTESSHHITN